MQTVLLYGFDLQTYEKYIKVLKSNDVSYICLKNTNYSLKRALEREERFHQMVGEEQMMIFHNFSLRDINKTLRALQSSNLKFSGLTITTSDSDLSTKLYIIIKNAKKDKEALYKRSLISKMLEKLEFVFISEDDERIERYREVVIQGYDIIKNNDNDLKRITKVLSSLNDMLKENML